MSGLDERMPADWGTAERLPYQRILVTGAQGFVGRHFVPALAGRLPQGARVVLAARNAMSSIQNNYNVVTFDLEKPDTVVAAVAETRPDLVIHLAAQASVGRSTKNSSATWSTNLCGSLILADALAKAAPDATFLFASSVEVYGLTFNDEIATEASPLRPLSAYARSKAAAEAMLADVLPGSARLIVARASNHSGWGQSEAFVVPAFAAQIARIERGAPSSIRVGNLTAERDFLDVRDVVSAYLALLAGATTLPSRSTFNVASGHTVSIGTILDRLRAMSPVKTAVELDPERMRPSEISRAAVDASAITKAVNWRPRYALEDMLAQVLANQREQ